MTYWRLRVLQSAGFATLNEGRKQDRHWVERENGDYLVPYILPGNPDTWEIHISCDDSVVRIFNRKAYPIRRSRGYAPDKLIVDWQFDRHLLACGPEQKNTFALAKNNAVYLSHHIGDMENIEVLNSLIDGVSHFRKIFDIQPKVVAYDLHPDYLSTKYAHEYSQEKGIKGIGIQHHHAHAVSCMVDNKINKPVLSVILDGTGFGSDETIWGGELLLTEYHQYKLSLIHI